MPAVVWLNVRVRLSQQFILFDWSICLIRMKFCMKIPFYVLFLVSIKSVNTVTTFRKNNNFYNFSQIVLLNN